MDGRGLVKKVSENSYGNRTGITGLGHMSVSLLVIPTSLSQALNLYHTHFRPIFSPLMFVITQRRGCYPHFTNEKPKAQRKTHLLKDPFTTNKQWTQGSSSS